jgi:hypothetical protein
MTPIADLSAALLLLTLVGILLRGRAHLCPSFAAYVAMAITTNRLMNWWPELFFNAAFYRAKESVYAIWYFVIVADLCATAFQAFPRARRAALGCLLFALCGSVAVAGFGPLEIRASWLGAFVPAANVGAAWALATFLAVATWYGLPLHPFHRGLALGLFLNLGLFGSVLELDRLLGPSMQPFISALDSAAYAATVAIWLWISWREANQTALSPATQQRLQPWAN